MSVTNDVDVLKVLKKNKGMRSVQVAAKMGLTVFQVTARLASMEKRQMVRRDKGSWFRMVEVEEVEKAQSYNNLLKQMRQVARETGEPLPTFFDDDVERVIITAGWSLKEYPCNGRGDYVTVFHDPNTGLDYTRSTDTERADLIRDMLGEFPDVRLSLFRPGNAKFEAVQAHARALRQMLEDL